MVDFTEKLRGDLIEQFKGQPNTDVLVSAIGRQLDEVAEFFEDLVRMRTIETAVGNQLDGIGDIVCLSREECAKYAGMFPSGSIGDEEYRALLKSKIIINTNDTTYYGIVRSIRSLYGAYPIYYSEDPNFPATIIFELDAAAGGNIAPLGFIPPVKAGGVAILWQYTIRAIIEVHFEVQSFPYSMPPCNTLYCGTFPCRATLGWTTRTVLRASVRLELPTYLTRLCGTYPNTATVGWLEKALTTAGFRLEYIKDDGKLCGTVPDISTLGKVLRFIAAVSDEASGHPFEPPVVGKDECGTIPSASTIAQRIEAAIRSEAALTDAAVTPPFANTEQAGVYPDRPSMAFIVDGGAEVSGAAEGIKKTPARSGMIGCGTAPERTATGGTAEAKAEISGSVDGVLVDAPYENTDCGTSPKTTATGAQTASEATLACSAEGFTASAPLCNTKYCGQN